jgi:aspartate aminotransferase
MMRGEFEKRRTYIVERLNAITDIGCFRSTGAFYAFPNVSALYGKSFAGKIIRNSSELAAYFLDEAKVAVVPGIAFGADNYIRLSYATSLDNIRIGIDRIEKAVSDLN